MLFLFQRLAYVDHQVHGIPSKATLPWYVSNATLHIDVGISYVQDVIHQNCNKHHTTLEPHVNPLLKTLLVREENRRLKRNWPIDLI
jgi:hypothetical protein